MLLKPIMISVSSVASNFRVISSLMVIRKRMQAIVSELLNYSWSFKATFFPRLDDSKTVIKNGPSEHLFLSLWHSNRLLLTNCC